MKKIFCAIKIKTNPKLQSIQTVLKQNLINEKINWTNLDNAHLTLKFFGEIDELIIPNIIENISKITSSTPSFSLEIKNIKIFGSNYNPKIIWLGVIENIYLNKLHLDIVKAVTPLGFAQDNQNFVPHITLGRIKTLKGKKIQTLINKYKFEDITKQNVEEIYLFESILTSKGAIYKEIQIFKLKER